MSVAADQQEKKKKRKIQELQSALVTFEEKQKEF